MKNSFKKHLAVFLLASGMTSISFAQTQMIQCPTLTANDVQTIIDKGFISTEQGYSLADEAGKSRAQVLIDEPTANPFDTYYMMIAEKNVDNQNYIFFIGNILGTAAYEAKERVKKILLSDEQTFTAQYDPENKLCLYKEVNASASLPNYPFKSVDESAFLGAIPYEDASPFMIQKLMKHRRRA